MQGLGLEPRPPHKKINLLVLVFFLSWDTGKLPKIFHLKLIFLGRS